MAKIRMQLNDGQVEQIRNGPKSTAKQIVMPAAEVSDVEKLTGLISHELAMMSHDQMLHRLTLQDAQKLEVMGREIRAMAKFAKENPAESDVSKLTNEQLIEALKK